MVKFPGIPAILQSLPKEIRSVLGPMKEILGMFTDPANPVVRTQQLVDAGIAQFDGQTLTPGGTDPGYVPPPTPTGLTAAGALASIILEWDDPHYDYLAHTEIWRAESNDISVAQLVGTSQARIYVDTIGGGAERFYWIRFVSNANPPDYSAFNAQAGVQAATAYDAGYLLDVLAANPPAGADFNPLLYVQATPTVISGVTIPAGTYMNAAYVRDLSVTSGHIAKLAVDDSHIANLNAGKINAGYIDAARIEVGSLDAKLANISAAVIGTGFLNVARIQDGSIANAKITDATITGAKIVDATITNAKIANATLDIAKINKATIANLSALSATIGTLRTATVGGRLEISDNVIKVFDALGNLRVKIGNLDL